MEEIVNKKKEEMILLVEQLEALIDEMPYKGDVCEDSQKMCLKNSLFEFSMNINGITDDDFKEISD